MTINDNVISVVKKLFNRDDLKIPQRISKNIFSPLSFKTLVIYRIFTYMDSLIKEKKESLSIQGIHNIFSNTNSSDNSDTAIQNKVKDPYKVKKLQSYRAFYSQNEHEQFSIILDQIENVFDHDGAINFSVFIKENIPQKSKKEYMEFVSFIDSAIQPITKIINDKKASLEEETILHTANQIKKRLNTLFTKDPYRTLLKDAQQLFRLKQSPYPSIKRFGELPHGSNEKSSVSRLINEEHIGNHGAQTNSTKKITYTPQDYDLEIRRARELLTEKYKIDCTCLESLTKTSPEELQFELLKLVFSEAFTNLVSEIEDISSKYLTEQLKVLSPADTSRISFANS